MNISIVRMDDAPTAKLLRAILERIRAQADAGLAGLNHVEETRAIHWRCAGCQHRKHFTKAVTVDATMGSACPKCGGTQYEPVTTP